MKSISKTAALCAVICSITAGVAAQDVNLTSADGKVQMSGTLVSFDEEFLLVKTNFGEFRLDRSTIDCDGAACPTDEQVLADLVIRGSDTVGEDLMPLLVDGYAAKMQSAVAQRQPAGEAAVQLAVHDAFGSGDRVMDVMIESQGSSTGFRALMADQTHIAMSSRPARTGEIKDLAAQGRGNLVDLQQEYIVAVDSILVVTSPNNPVEELTIQDVGRIFAGQIDNWSQVGGPNQPITVYSRNSNSGTLRFCRPSPEAHRRRAVVIGRDPRLKRRDRR